MSQISPEPRIAMLKKLCIAAVFAIAFAYIEAAVVVYLREIFYPAGFTFPLASFPDTSLGKRILLTEIGREVATIVVIFSVSWLFTKGFMNRLACFLFTFGVWDIFFYAWLKLFLNWPASLMDWDILFLIPVVWAGPVLSPVLVSIAIIFFSAAFFLSWPYSRPVQISRLEWLGLLAAGIVIVVSFCIGGLHITDNNFRVYFSWPLFTVGYILAAAIFVRCILKSK